MGDARSSAVEDITRKRRAQGIDFLPDDGRGIMFPGRFGRNENKESIAGG